MVAKERYYVEVCWVPRCRPVAYHVSKIQWCPSARLRISPVCGQVSSIVISLCCPRRVTAVLLRSVRSWQNGCSSCTGSNRVRLAMPRTLTNRPFLFSQRSRASSQGFCSCSSVLCRDSVSILSVSGGLRSDVEAIHKCILSCCELSQVHGRLHIRQIETRQNFIWDLVSLRTKSCLEEEQMWRLFACHQGWHSQLLLKNICPRPRSLWQPKSFNNSFDNKSGAPPGTTCTRSTLLAPGNSNKEYGHCLGFQCLIVIKNGRSWSLTHHHFFVNICSHFYSLSNQET